MVRMAVCAVAWVWTWVFIERRRVHTMWLLNEKVAVRAVGKVRGSDGAVLLVADPSGEWSLPGVSLGRFDQPQSRLREHLESTHGIKADEWRPVSARRSRGTGLDGVYLCDVVGAHPLAKASMTMKFMKATNLHPSVDVASRQVIGLIGATDFEGGAHA